MSDAAIATVKISKAAGFKMSHSRAKGKPVLTHWMEVQDYFISNLANEPIEYAMGLCLDSQNHLIIDKTVLSGKVNQASTYPRKIVNLVLRHFAHAVFFVHNNPGAETKPPRANIEVTKDIKKALAVMGIALLDHLIVAGASCISFESLCFP
jgi:DNA repair protein RadC